MDAQKVKGIIVPLLTPTNENEEVQYSRIEPLINYVIEGGVDACFAMGTTGEFMRFDAITRGNIASAVVKYAAGRLPVYVGVSDCGTRLVIDHIRRAEDAGAAAIVTTLPYYVPNTSVSESIQFLEDVAQSTSLPVILYNIPATVGSSIALDVIDRVIDIRNIVAIKDSSGDMAYLKALLARSRTIRKPFSVIVGNEQVSYEGLASGADGLVPSLANPFPKLLKAVYESAADSNLNKLRYYCDIVDRFNSLNSFSDSWMSPNIWRKEAMEMLGIIGHFFTKPYTPVSDEVKQKISQTINEYQLLFP